MPDWQKSFWGVNYPRLLQIKKKYDPEGLFHTHHSVPQYMSPEQASGRADLDGRSDIYSLGVMGYAVLAGRLPFEGKSAAEILSKHLTQQPPALRSFAPEVSDSTVQAVERCLSKDPAERLLVGDSQPDVALESVFGEEQRAVVSGELRHGVVDSGGGGQNASGSLRLPVDNPESVG